jgi:hypothetical protein
MHKSDFFHCRVCGYKPEDPPWGEDGQTPLFDLCDCCGVEYGYEDSTPAGARIYREKWIKSGAPWRLVREKPIDWVLDAQLQHVPHEFLT